MNLSDLKVGDTVRAFHPATLGVIYTANVVTVGRKFVTVTFPMFGPKRWKLIPDHVTEVV